MTPESALSFAGLCLLLSISPGPDSLLVLRLAMNRPCDGIAVAAGSATGSLLWAGAVAVGLARVLDEHPALTGVLHVAGGVYLTVLGIREIIQGRAFFRNSEVMIPIGGASFRMGLFSCVLNPKVGLFFLLLAPQYAPDLTIASIMALGVIDAAVAFLYLGLLALCAGALLGRLTGARAQRVLRVGSGAAIAAVGASIVVGAFL